jgi:hypothetical protein
MLIGFAAAVAIVAGIFLVLGFRELRRSKDRFHADQTR